MVFFNGFLAAWNKVQQHKLKTFHCFLHSEMHQHVPHLWILKLLVVLQKAYENPQNGLTSLDSYNNVNGKCCTVLLPYCYYMFNPILRSTCDILLLWCNLSIALRPPTPPTPTPRRNSLFSACDWRSASPSVAAWRSPFRTLLLIARGVQVGAEGRRREWLEFIMVKWLQTLEAERLF